MDRELQIAFVAAGFGVLGTLLGSILQYLTAERSARLRRQEEHKTRLRDEKREGYAKFLAGVSDIFSEIQYPDSRLEEYSFQGPISQVSDDVLQDLRTRLNSAGYQLGRRYAEVLLIVSMGEVAEASNK